MYLAAALQSQVGQSPATDQLEVEAFGLAFNYPIGSKL